MKLFRWAAAGASVYVIYKYSIGKKAKGEKVFDSPQAKPEPKPEPDTAPGQSATKRAKPRRANRKP